MYLALVLFLLSIDVGDGEGKGRGVRRGRGGYDSIKTLPKVKIINSVLLNSFSISGCRRQTLH